MSEFHVNLRRRSMAPRSAYKRIPIHAQGWKRHLWAPVLLLIWLLYAMALAFWGAGMGAGLLGELISGWLYTPEVRG